MTDPATLFGPAIALYRTLLPAVTVAVPLVVVALMTVHQWRLRRAEREVHQDEWFAR
jgi:hypothetical protein